MESKVSSGGSAVGVLQQRKLFPDLTCRHSSMIKTKPAVRCTTACISTKQPGGLGDQAQRLWGSLQTLGTPDIPLELPDSRSAIHTPLVSPVQSCWYREFVSIPSFLHQPGICGWGRSGVVQ